jgi:hypothetical protein
MDNQNQLLKNKKGVGAYTVRAISMISMIIIVCLVFVAALWIQFSKPYDIRGLENAQIAKKIVLCLTNDTLVLPQESFTEKRLNECIKTDQNIFIKLTFEGKEIVSGRKELEVYCKIQNKVSGNYLPACLNYNYTVLNSSYREDKLNVFLSLDKNRQNVQLIPNK